MKSFCALVLVIVCGAWLAGCGPRAEPPPPAPSNPLEPTQAQPRLPTIRLFLDQHTLTAEIARAPHEIVAGMMFRTNLPPGEAMLFVFPDLDRRAFWMKNCVVPLTAAYLDPDGVIREIRDLQPGNTNTVPTESRRIQYVLEANQGWFDRHGVRPGTLVRTERGTLRESFFPYQPGLDGR